MDPNEKVTIDRVAEHLAAISKSIDVLVPELEGESIWRKRAKMVGAAALALLALVLVMMFALWSKTGEAAAERRMEHSSLAVEIDCRLRRAALNLPPPPDSTRSCVEQTPPQLQSQNPN